MTIGDFLSQATADLRSAGIESARLDVLLLLEDEVGHSRAHLLAHLDDVLSPTALRSLNKKCIQRESHLPLAYIRQAAFFYGRAFYVDKHVLVPRPESEDMISLLLDAALPLHPKIVDVGTGSGCLGITALLEIPEAEITLRDISMEALDIARKNTGRMPTGIHSRVKFEHADLLTGALPADVILANLPYVPTQYPVNAAAQHEPAIALFAGEDGLELYRDFWKQIPTIPGYGPRVIVTESLESQHSQIVELAAAAGYKMSQTRGLAQLFVPSSTK